MDDEPDSEHEDVDDLLPQNELYSCTLYPEDFLTDSEVHVSKLSDEEFKKRKNCLLDYIDTNREVYSSPLHNETNYDYWISDNEEDKDKEDVGEKEEDVPMDGVSGETYSDSRREQYRKVLDRRGEYLLPLPVPVNFGVLGTKDRRAVFDKMHSRAFARSHRLCKDVNTLLVGNRRTFRIRIRNRALANRVDTTGPSQCIFQLECLIDQYTHVDIPDASAIRPFTFDSVPYSCLDWLMNSKWPCLKINLNLRRSSELDIEPWMEDQNVWIKGEMTEARWELLKELKPAEICFSSVKTLDLDKLLSSAKTLKLVGTWEDIVQIVERWKNGSWTFQVRQMKGNLPTDIDCQYNFNQAAAGCHCMTKKTGDGNPMHLLFVPNVDGHFLVFVLKRESAPFRWNYTALFNIATVSDLILYQKTYIKSALPVDWSGYSGDLDAPLNPVAFCDLLQNYNPVYTNYHENNPLFI